MVVVVEVGRGHRKVRKGSKFLGSRRKMCGFGEKKP